jgi:hypothetical protein
MYYFIFDAIKSSKQRAEAEKIKDIAREFSILSVSSHVSPARNADELVQDALAKNYTTIVCVGEDTLINEVASALIKYSASPVALGIISTDPNSILSERWGYRTLEEAVETLKYRKLDRFTLGMIEPDHFFLSSARIECRRPTRFVIEIDRFKVEAILDRIEISNNLYILLERFGKEKSFIKSTFNWISGKESTYADRSVFRGKIIKISSREATPILIGNKAVARTPISVFRKINALNIITKRDKVI